VECSGESATNAGQVQSLVRALTILQRLSELSCGSSLADLAREVGLPKSTAHRLLTSLESQRFVRFNRTDNTWAVGVRAFTVGASFVRGRDIRELADGAMQRLAREIRETINLSSIDNVQYDNQLMYIGQARHNSAQASVVPGMIFPLYSTAAGKVMLAYGAEDYVAGYAASVQYRKRTMRTIMSAESLHREILAIRTRGYAIDDEENRPGIRCLAVVIFDENAAPRASLSISAPVDRLPQERFERLALQLRRTAEVISAELGGRRQTTATPCLAMRMPIFA